MKTNHLFVLLFFIVLSSCESFIIRKGYVYDKITKKPIMDVKVILIAYNRDTAFEYRREYDSIPKKERNLLRKSGVRDVFRNVDTVGYFTETNLIPYTDSNGYYDLSCGFDVGNKQDCPRTRIFFSKIGYKTQVDTTDTDEVEHIYLEPEN